MLFGRFLIPFLPGLFVLGAPTAWSAPPGGLPPVAVGAEASLVKVAEFRMREPRFGAAAVAQGDYLYIVGGSNAGSWVLDSIERMDCRTGASEPFARLERGRIWHRVVQVGRTLYVLGGETVTPDASGQPTQRPDDSVEIIDLSTGRIARGPALPEPMRSFGCVLVEGRIHLFGGLVQTGASAGRSDRTWIFDLKTGRWSRGEPMPTPREADAVLVDGPEVVVPGGYNGVEALAVVEGFNPRDGLWRTLPPLCRPASAHALAHLGHHLLLFGHYDDPGQCLAYDLRTGQSEPLALRFTGMRHSAAVVHGGRIYVIGGRAHELGEPQDLVQVFALREKPG